MSRLPQCVLHHKALKLLYFYVFPPPADLVFINKPQSKLPALGNQIVSSENVLMLSLIFALIYRKAFGSLITINRHLQVIVMKSFIDDHRHRRHFVMNRKIGSFNWLPLLLLLLLLILSL